MNQPAADTETPAPAAIQHGHVVLARAGERAWKTGGPCVVFAMKVLELALKDCTAALLGDGQDRAEVFSDAEAVTSYLIKTVRRVCGGDEADYVGGDE